MSGLAVQAQERHWFFDDFSARDEAVFEDRTWGKKLNWQQELRRRRAERAFQKQLRRERRDRLLNRLREDEYDRLYARPDGRGGVEVYEGREPEHRFRYHGAAPELQEQNDRDFVAKPEGHQDWRQQAPTSRAQQPRRETLRSAPTPQTNSSRAQQPPAQPAPRKKAEPKVAGGISCGKARSIVAGFGFTDIEPVSCSGKEFELKALRDGKPFSIKLSGKTGELTNVKRL